MCLLPRIGKARKVDRALHNVFCIVTLSIVIYVDNRGGSRGGGAPPKKKFEKIRFFGIKVIFHTKYPKNFRASLRSAQFFLSAPPPLI